MDRTVGETAWAQPGTKAGLAVLESFIDVRLKLFDSRRNDPNVAALSQLSPWIRFGGSEWASVPTAVERGLPSGSRLLFFSSGHLSAQQVALQVQRSEKKSGVAVSSFMEELVVRRELTDNFCFYNDKYDSVEGQCASHLHLRNSSIARCLTARTSSRGSQAPTSGLRRP